jgi:hypothetical protein
VVDRLASRDGAGTGVGDDDSGDRRSDQETDDVGEGMTDRLFGCGD